MTLLEYYNDFVVTEKVTDVKFKLKGYDCVYTTIEVSPIKGHFTISHTSQDERTYTMPVIATKEIEMFK